MNDEQRREARARSTLRRFGLLVRKDRAKARDASHQGGYMLVNLDNEMETGEHFDITLEELERTAGDLQRDNRLYG